MRTSGMLGSLILPEHARAAGRRQAERAASYARFFKMLEVCQVSIVTTLLAEVTCLQSRLFPACLKNSS